MIGNVEKADVLTSFMQSFAYAKLRGLVLPIEELFGRFIAYSSERQGALQRFDSASSPAPLLEVQCQPQGCSEKEALGLLSIP